MPARALFSCLLILSPVQGLDLFAGTGQAPRHTYRIPTLAVTAKGTLLAFAELRKNNASDTGDIDTVLRRSTDGGRSWSEETVILDRDDHTFGNACPIVDPQTGRILLIGCWNALPEKQLAAGFGDDSRKVYLTYSDDDGLSWSPPEDITRQVKQGSWSWFASGPGAGIALTRGPHRGRLVLGVNHRETTGDSPGDHSHVIWSDDHGKTWRSSRAYAARHTNECEVAEREDGVLMLNMRNHGSDRRERAVALSRDGGESWEETRWDPALPEPQCMGSLKRHSFARDGKPGLLLFSNPASRERRENLTLRGSYDEGRTWSLQKVIEPGPASYSHLAVLPDGDIALAYEVGKPGKIRFARFQAGSLEPVPASTAEQPGDPKTAD